MLGSVKSVFLRLRTSALVVSFGVIGLAACASSENATFEEPGGAGGGGNGDAGLTDAKADATPDTDSGSDAGSGGSGGTGGTGGGDTGGSGGTGGSNEPDTCGIDTCPAPDYPDFEKCCTTEGKCGYRNGPSGYCYDATTPEEPPPGAGGGP